MDPSLEQIDKNVRHLIASEGMHKYKIPHTIRALENCPYDSFEELLDSVRRGDAVVIQGFQQSDAIFNIISRPQEKLLFRISLFAPCLITGGLMIAAFLLHNYWLLLCVVFPLAAPLFTSPQFPIKGIIFVGSLALAGLGLATASSGLLLFFGAYCLSHIFAKILRQTYTRVLFRRAFALESVYILLHSGSYILLRDRHRKPFKS